MYRGAILRSGTDKAEIRSLGTPSGHRPTMWGHQVVP